jgi:hypothetical protein
MPWDLQWKNLRLKQGDICMRTREDLTALIWKGKKDLQTLTNMNNPPAEGNFCDKNGNVQKPAIAADCNIHMGYVDKGDKTADSYTISCCMWK